MFQLKRSLEPEFQFVQLSNELEKNTLMLVIKQKIYTHQIMINLYIAIQNTRLRSRGVGVYFLILGEVGAGVYFFIFGGIGAGVYNFETPGVGAGAGVYFILATPQFWLCRILMLIFYE